MYKDNAKNDIKPNQLPMLYWWRDIDRGYFMAGVISSDIRSNRCDCGAKFIKVKDAEYTNPVPRCEACNKPPKKLRIRVTLPAGLGKKIIRYTDKGLRLKTLAQCDSYLIDLHEQIKSKNFQPENFTGKKDSDKFKLIKFLEADLAWRESQPIGSKGCSPAYLVDIKKMIKNHLAPVLGEMDIREIKYIHLKDFLLHESKRQRVKSLQYLRPVLKEAAKSITFSLPTFPQLEAAKKLSKTVNRADQLKIVEACRTHYEAIKTCTIYPIRPCEVRALKWIDIDFKNQTITIRRHFSAAELLSGRKSHYDGLDKLSELTLKLRPEFIELIKDLPRPIDSDNFVFLTRTGKPLYESAIRKSWGEACKRLGVDGVHSYNGLKHATLSYYINDIGVSVDEAKVLAGHTDIRSTERYLHKDNLQISERIYDRIDQIETDKLAEPIALRPKS